MTTPELEVAGRKEEPTTTPTKTKIVHRPTTNANQFERRVFKLLEAFFDEGRICDLGGGHANRLDIGRQVDASFRFLNKSQDYFFIVECKDVEDPHSLKLKDAVDQLKANYEMVEAIYKPKYCPKSVVKPVLAVNVSPDDVKSAPDSVSTLMTAGFNFDYLTKDHLEYYEGLLQSYGPKYTFPVFLLEVFHIREEYGDPIIVPALKTHRLDKDLYTFLMSASDLIAISYVHRATSFEIAAQAYQRMLNSGRLKTIAKSLDEKRFEVNFPNNIVVNLESTETKFVPDGVDSSSGKLELVNRYGAIRVVDGQHRLFSFLFVKDASLKNDYRFVVSAFENLTQDEQSEIFATINYNAKRVTPDLIDYLFSLESNKTRIGHAAHICIKLDNEDRVFGPDRLFLGYQKGRRRRYLGLHALVRILSDDKRYRLITDKGGRIQKDGDDEEEPRRILKEYFASMQTIFKRDWEKRNKGFVKTSNGIAVFLGILSRIAEQERSLSKLNTKTFDRYFARLKGIRWTNYREAELTSEGARRNAVNELCKKMRL